MQLEKIKKVTLLGLELDTILLYTLYTLSFLIPLLIKQPQLLIGSCINFIIVFTSLRYGFKKSIPVLLLPSLVSVGSGLLFGSATIFLIYLAPFIIISNSILSLFTSWKKNILGISLGILLKVGFLYSMTLLLTKIIGLPEVFLASMGIIQLYTALIGSTVAIVLSKLVIPSVKNS